MKIILGVREKIIYAFGIVIAVTMILMISIAVLLIELKEQVDGLFGIEYLVEADRDLYQSHLALSYLLNPSRASRFNDKDKLIFDVTSNLSQVDERYNLFKNIYLNESELIHEFAVFESGYNDFAKITNELVSKIQSNSISEAQAIFFDKYPQFFNATRKHIDEFTDITMEIAIESNKTSSFIIQNIYVIIIIMLTFIISLLSAMGILIANSISSPVAKLANSLSETSSQITKASDELSNSSQAIANGATEQAATIEEISSSVEELESIVKNNSSNAENAYKSSEEVTMISESGYSQMKELLSSINEISKFSDEIVEIIDIIEDIAFQTNMLALNAAVEAARAGEVGMGFAVVADEVKALANRSSESANETTKRIKESINKTNSGKILAEKLSDTFQKILSSNSELTKMSKGIEISSNEQSIGISQVSKALTQFSNVMQSNAASSEQTASAAEELKSQSGMLDDVINQLNLIVKGSRKSAG